MKKRMISLLLALGMALGLVPVSAGAAETWYDAYQDFVMNQRYLRFTGASNTREGYDTEPYFDPYGVEFYLDALGHFLWDLNKDGVPELFVENGGPTGGTAATNVFTFTDQGIVFLGAAYGWPLGPDKGGTYPGLFFEGGGVMEGGMYYYFMENGQLASEPMEEKDGGPPVNVSTNPALYKVYKNLYQELEDTEYSSRVPEQYSLPEIKAMSWDGFIAKYGFSKPAAAPQPAAGGDAAQSVDINSLPQQEELKSLLEWTSMYVTNAQYHCKTITSENSGFLAEMISRPMEGGDYWTYYPGSASQYIWGPEDGPSDPLNKWGSYAKSDKTKIDWMMTNILNCSQADLDTLLSRWKAGNTGYEYQGSYYGYFDPDQFGEAAWDVVFRSAQFDGSYYYVEYDYYYGPLSYALDLDSFHREEEPTRRYATLSLKTIDGKNYWSLYADSYTGFVKFDPPVETTPAAPTTVAGFTDVSANAWYAGDVVFVAEKGLMKGNSASTFNPKGEVTVAEAVTMAARLHSVYTTGKEAFVQSGENWYDTYVDYAKKNGIIGDVYGNVSMTAKATRAQFADIFASALPDRGLKRINTVPDRAIPDVSMRDSYAASVYKLYRAGVLTGGDDEGTFFPLTTITRAEAAAIVSRMAEEGNRVSFKLTAPKAATGHRYEFVISDVSWTQAQKDARSAGGHLASFETEEEYEAFLAELDGKSLTTVRFFLGARRDADETAYHWVDRNNKLLTAQRLNDPEYWAGARWAAEEPSYVWKDDVEKYVQIVYDGSGQQWVWSDVADQVYTPGVNRFGYVIEYDR